MPFGRHLEYAKLLQQVVALFVVGAGDVGDRVLRSPTGEEKPVGQTAPGVEAGVDRLPQVPDAIGPAVLGEQQCGDLDGVAEAPAV
ncbi:hypothetical protein [Streptomyces thermoalcalitolerans]|uniref:Uncharacterized protein n=1 Tax=Streptomyces thermoalcalitolerans TaxID=65605 RepID=A0ABP3YY01_9ACTN